MISMCHAQWLSNSDEIGDDSRRRCHHGNVHHRRHQNEGNLWCRKIWSGARKNKKKASKCEHIEKNNPNTQSQKTTTKHFKQSKPVMAVYSEFQSNKIWISNHRSLEAHFYDPVAIKYVARSCFFLKKKHSNFDAVKKIGNTKVASQ